MNDQLSRMMMQFSAGFLPLLLAITMNASARAYVAFWSGDRALRMLGRVTLNPARHIDPLGTLLLPAFTLFTGGLMVGWAKLLPIDERAFRHRRRGQILVALAGPVANVVMMLIALMLVHIARLTPDFVRPWLFASIQFGVTMNAGLAFFYLLPIPPMPGGQLLIALLPYRQARALAQLEPHGFMIAIGLLVFLPMIGRQLHMDLNPVGDWISFAATHLIQFGEIVTGLV